MALQMTTAITTIITTTEVETADAVTITGYTGSATSVTIPAQINGKPVTTIGTQAFSNKNSITSVTIPNSVTSIGTGAFYGTSLTSVSIPDSVTRIDSSAFNETPWLNNQSDGVVYAGKVALRYKGTMPANTSITLQDGTKVIADYAFSRSTNLTNITIPNSVTNIGDRAFEGCISLTSVIIGSGVTSIGAYAFMSCENLTSVTIPASVTRIGANAFYTCSNLRSITFQGTITEDNLISPFNGDLKIKYLAGGIGTYTTETVHLNSVWAKQD